MSWIQKTEDGEEQLYEGEFHRVELIAGQKISIGADDKPVAVWIPSDYELEVKAKKAMVIDVAEVVEHVDIVAMEKKLREMRRDQKRAQARERQARRRLRRLDRPERPTP